MYITDDLQNVRNIENNFSDSLYIYLKLENIILYENHFVFELIHFLTKYFHQ